MKLRRAQITAVIVIVVLITLYFLLDIDRQLNFDNLLKTLQSLKATLNSQPILFTILFFLLYVVVTASSVPVATALTLSGGVLLGSVIAPLVIIPAATLGCIIPYFAARLLLKDYVQNRFKKALVRVNKGIDDSGWWFLLSARLNPILPFFVLNLVSGIANVTFRQYTSATLLGIIPSVLIVTYAGSQITASAEEGTIIRPEVFAALLLLAVVPLLVRYIQKRLMNSKGTYSG